MKISTFRNLFAVVALAIAAILPLPAAAQAFTDYAENKLVDAAEAIRDRQNQPTPPAAGEGIEATRPHPEEGNP